MFREDDDAQVFKQLIIFSLIPIILFVRFEAARRSPFCLPTGPSINFISSGVRLNDSATLTGQELRFGRGEYVRPLLFVITLKIEKRLECQVTHTKHILCVDDDEDSCSMLVILYSCSMLVILLSDGDIEAVSVSDPTEGLKLVEKEKFDLYILDGILKGTSAELLSKEIRAVDQTTPIIIFTGNSQQEAREAALSAGANAYVLKPHPDELRKTVRRMLYGRGGISSVLLGD